MRPKDLRDSFASQLLMAGFPLIWVSKQPGHANVGVTARHDAKWIGDDYLEPPKLEPGEEVPTNELPRSDSR